MGAGLAARLLYAVPDPDGGRFWDERYSYRNVRSLVAQGSVRPQNGFYPSLSYLPHAALIAAGEGLHRVTGIEALSMLDPEGPFGFSESAVLAARLVSVLAGTLTIGLVYLLGRRLASPTIGLLAAGIVSASWTHLFVSAKFKPDVLTVLVFAVAFWWILDAIERPTAAQFALAGLGVGLSASTKYLGASVAIPLMASALFASGKKLRVWAGLALAGAVAVGSFAALNPWLSLIVHDMSVTRRDYSAKAAAAGETHWTVVLEELAWLRQDHRPVVAFFVALGCVGLAARALGRLEGRPTRVEAVAVVTAILGHSVFYAGATRHFEDWNYLPVLPFTAFAAAWAVAGLVDRVTGPLPRSARDGLRLAAAGAAVPLVLAFPIAVSYVGAVPTTSELLRRSLSSGGPVHSRIAYAEGIGTDLERDPSPPRFLLLEVESLLEVPPIRLDLADAVVFPARSLEGPEARTYSRLLDPDDGSVSRIEARWFRARGPSLVVVRHRWEPRGEVLHGSLAGSGESFRVPLAEPLRAGEVVSLAVRMRRRGGRMFPGAVEVQGAEEAPLQQLRPGRTAWMVTPRMRSDRRLGALELRFKDLDEGVQPLEIELYRWRRGTGAGP